MKRFLLVSLLFAPACGSRPAVPVGPSDGAPSATSVASTVAPPSPTCVAARSTRGEADALDRGGHEVLALAKLDEANAACPAERATSAALEWKLLAATAHCGRVRAAPSAAPGAKEARATCDALEVPSTGTAATMRAKMHEAFAAERAKDWARAKSLYLAAWAEQHPNPRAVESAARMAALAGDAAESRRLRDRALLEAEAAEHAVARVTERVRVASGMPSLAGGTLLLAHAGKVVARDVETGEVRVLVDAHAGVTRLSPGGTLAVSIAQAYLSDATTLTVWDVTTGARLFQVDNALGWTISPDDTRMLVRDGGGASYDASSKERVIDTSTGAVIAKPAESVTSAFFTPDATHLALFGDASAPAFELYDLGRRSAIGKLPAQNGVGATSADGHYFVYIDSVSDGASLHVRDMTAHQDVAAWAGHFHSIEALAVSNDGKTVATGSRNSLRLWDVAQKKQTFKYDTFAADGVTDSRYTDQFAFSDDGETMVLAGDGTAQSWDVATGTLKPLATEQPRKKVLRVVPAPQTLDAVAIVLEDEVRIVPATGEPRSVCAGTKPRYAPEIGPTSVAYSASGKSFACAMADGWVHVFDTSTWKERAVVKRGAKSPEDRPVDLAFSADEKALTVTSDVGFVTYDAATAAQTARVVFRHAGVGLAPRHARFDDGKIAVRAWNGALALFGADGAFERDVKLAAGLPVGAVDAFAPDGTTYAIAVGKTLHVVDLASGEDRKVELPSAAKSVAVARGGKTLAVAGADKRVSLVSGGAVTPLAGASGTRAWIVGGTVLVAESDDTVGAFALDASAATGPALEIDPNGVVVRDAAGAFELRGKPEVECVVGSTFLTETTCADRTKPGLVAAWTRAAAPK